MRREHACAHLGRQSPFLTAETAESAEFISVLGQYNLDWGDGPPLHYLLADRGGASAVVEFVRGEMRVRRNRDPWQVATHLVLSEVGAAAPDDLCPRYHEANATLTRSAGRLSSEEALALLGRISQPNTRWSTLYDLRSGAVQVALGRAYERVHAFGVGMRYAPADFSAQAGAYHYHCPANERVENGW